MMKNTARINSLSNFFPRNLFRVAQQKIKRQFGQADFDLNQSILHIMQQTDLSKIAKSFSQSLKELLNYELFGFAFNFEDQMDVWVDPGTHQKTIKRILEKEFTSLKLFQFHKFTKRESAAQQGMIIKDNDLNIFSLYNDKFTAKVFILSQKKITHHQRKILDLLLQTIEVALKNYVHLKHYVNMALIDGLTGCYNRRELTNQLHRLVSQAKRYQKDLSIIMLDIDHFKQVNDIHGHQAGDDVLKAVSKAIHGSVRSSDYVARYGGEEFVIILPDTKITRALEMAERIRKTLENLEIPVNDRLTLRVTSSFGVTTLKKEMTPDTFLKRADELLYHAKKSGRNCVMPAIALITRNKTCV